jgi:pimeloyl-ACP methyl ester carboxylesterase
MIIKILKIFSKIVYILISAVSILLLFFGLRWYLNESEEYKDVAPSKGYFTIWSDVEIFVQENGPKDWEVILFIHGTASWSEIWKESMIYFWDLGYRTIAIDLPPFGYSEKPTNQDYSLQKQSERIVWVVESLNLNSVILVWHSFWAKPTSEAAFHMPDKVKWQIIVDGALWLNTATGEKGILINIVNSITPLRNALLHSTITNPLFSKKILASLLYDPKDATSEIVSDMLQPSHIKWTTHSLWEWISYLLYEKKNNLSDDINNYKAIQYPVWIIWWEKDTITPLSQGEYLDEIIPNSHLSILPNIWHIPHLEDIVLFNKVLNKEIQIISAQ